MNIRAGFQLFVVAEVSHDTVNQVTFAQTWSEVVFRNPKNVGFTADYPTNSLSKKYPTNSLSKILGFSVGVLYVD